MTPEIREALKNANGRRRVRTLSEEHVLQVVIEAREDGYGYTGGATVANSYGYPAFRTVCFAAGRKDGGVTVAIGTARANKGSAPKPYWVPLARVRPQPNPVDLEAWAETPTEHDIVLTRAQVTSLIRAERAAARQKASASLEKVPDVMLTREISLQVGNCERETDKVASWFDGKAVVPARDVAKEVLEREPNLFPFVLRAAEFAARPAVAV